MANGAAAGHTPAAAEFAAHLPLTFYMMDYANREKHAHMDCARDDSLQENITVDHGIWDFQNGITSIYIMFTE